MSTPRWTLPRGICTACRTTVGLPDCACKFCGLDFCSRECGAFHVCTLKLDAALDRLATTLKARS